jgi:hypothetical protein
MWRRNREKKRAKRKRRWAAWLCVKPRIRQAKIKEWREEHKLQVAQRLWNMPKCF